MKAFCIDEPGKFYSPRSQSPFPLPEKFSFA